MEVPILGVNQKKMQSDEREEEFAPCATKQRPDTAVEKYGAAIVDDASASYLLLRCRVGAVCIPATVPYRNGVNIVWVGSAVVQVRTILNRFISDPSFVKLHYRIFLQIWTSNCPADSRIGKIKIKKCMSIGTIFFFIRLVVVNIF